jgi:hypothetical protein
MAKGEFAKQAYTGLPTWAKGVIAVGVLAGVGFIVYKLYQKAQDVQEVKDSKEEVKEVEKELNDLNKNPNTKQTLSVSDAKAIANNIFTAMDGYGTDEVAILKQLIKLKNQADWLAIRAEWGVREVSSGRGNPEPNFKGTLEAALTSELGDTPEDIVVKKKVNEHFAKVGITARI